jgi:DNA-binding XRE family transcriptional regulator
MKAINVKEIRKKFGWRQDELAEKIGVSRKTITNYETGGVIPESKKVLLLSLLSNTVLETASEFIPRAQMDSFDRKIREVKEKINSRNEIIQLLNGKVDEIKHHQEMIDLYYTQIEIITAAQKDFNLE